MAYADLHRHLDGSLRPQTIAELADARGLDVPADLPFSVGMGLDAALGKFAFTLSLLDTPDAVRRVAAEMCEDAAADNVTTLEIRFAPQLHGPDAASFVDAALDGIAGRAGLILCGLYGEDPVVLEGHVEIGRTRDGVVAIDLAGGPVPAHAIRLQDYVVPFRLAAEHGLGRTVHASEGRPPDEIRIAVEVLGAQRIGHGTTLLHDPAILGLVLDREVTIEACPTSNWQVGVIRSVEEHPLPAWLARGVKACVNTDNTYFSAVTSSEEHRRAAAIPGMDDGKLAAAIAFGHQGAFRR